MDQGLTVRDKDVLKYLAQNRFATVRNIETLFWNGKGNRNHYRRLYFLSRKGLIAPLMGDGKMRLGFCLTRKGINYLKRNGAAELKLTELRSTYRTTFDHEQILQEIRNILEYHTLVSSYEPEHKVRERLVKKYGYENRVGSGYKVPDACFLLQTIKRPFRVALELEIAQKSKRRYLELFKRLMLSPDWDIVFIIVAVDKIRTRLQEYLQQVREQNAEVKISKTRHGIYFARLQDFLLLKAECPFSGEGKTFSLASLNREISENHLTNASS